MKPDYLEFVTHIMACFLELPPGVVMRVERTRFCDFFMVWLHGRKNHVGAAVSVGEGYNLEYYRDRAVELIREYAENRYVA